MSRSSKPDPFLSALESLTKFAIPFVEKSKEATRSERVRFDQLLAENLEGLTQKQKVQLTTELSKQSEKLGQVFQPFSNVIQIEHRNQTKALDRMQAKEAHLKQEFNEALGRHKIAESNVSFELATADRRIEAERIIKFIEDSKLEDILKTPASYQKFSTTYQAATKHTEYRDTRMDALFEIEGRVNGFVKKREASAKDREFISARISLLASELGDGSKLLKTHLTNLVTRQEVATERYLAALAHKEVIDLVDSVRRNTRASYDTRSLSPSSTSSRSSSDISVAPARPQRGRF